jgi:hypothetical protein
MGLKAYGKHVASVPLKAVLLAAYVAASAITYSPTVRWDQYVTPDEWSILANDQVGDCVPAAGLHLRQTWAAVTGGTFTPTAEQALAVYSGFSGYNPATGANDNGVDENQFCQSWVSTGLLGDKAAGTAQINWTNLDLLKFAIETFGGVLVGTQITQQCEDQFDAGQPWEDGWFFSPVKGLHGIPLLGFDETYFYANTWGRIQEITPQWVVRRFDEAHVIVDLGFLKSGKTPGGLDLDQLLADQTWAAAA